MSQATLRAAVCALAVGWICLTVVGQNIKPLTTRDRPDGTHQGGDGGTPESGCPGAGDCCFENGSPGCEEPCCCDCVCEQDPYCCDVNWDNLCGDQACMMCAGHCHCCTTAFVDDSFPVTAEIDLEMTDIGREVVSLAGQAVEVREAEPYCPGEVLDLQVSVLNMSGSSPLFGPVGIDGDGYGKVLVKAVDKDYSLTDGDAQIDFYLDVSMGIQNSSNEDPVRVTAQITSMPPYGATFEFVAGGVGACPCLGDFDGDEGVTFQDLVLFLDCLAAGGGPGCDCGDLDFDDGVTFQDLVLFLESLDSGQCVPTGDPPVALLQDDQTVGLVWGLQLTIGQPPPCPGAGDCCEANGTTGCDDADCCECVCALDVYCCEVDWDDICADESHHECCDLCDCNEECP